MIGSRLGFHSGLYILHYWFEPFCKMRIFVLHLVDERLSKKLYSIWFNGNDLSVTTFIYINIKLYPDTLAMQTLAGRNFRKSTNSRNFCISREINSLIWPKFAKIAKVSFRESLYPWSIWFSLIRFEAVWILEKSDYRSRILNHEKFSVVYIYHHSRILLSKM